MKLEIFRVITVVVIVVCALMYIFIPEFPQNIVNAVSTKEQPKYLNAEQEVKDQKYTEAQIKKYLLDCLGKVNFTADPSDSTTMYNNSQTWYWEGIMEKWHPRSTHPQYLRDADKEMRDACERLNDSVTRTQQERRNFTYNMKAQKYYAAYTKWLKSL